MEKDAKIYVAGHSGMLGTAIVRMLKERGHDNLLLRTSSELDLRRQADVDAFFERERPQYVILAAARVGGIWANVNNPAPFFYDNVMIQLNVIHAAWRHGTQRLLFVSSSCSYPGCACSP
jgi:GDP-L-fucose synthase